MGGKCKWSDLGGGRRELSQISGKLWCLNFKGLSQVLKSKTKYVASD